MFGHGKQPVRFSNGGAAQRWLAVPVRVCSPVRADVSARITAERCARRHRSSAAREPRSVDVGGEGGTSIVGRRSIETITGWRAEISGCHHTRTTQITTWQQLILPGFLLKTSWCPQDWHSLTTYPNTTKLGERPSATQLKTLSGRQVKRWICWSNDWVRSQVSRYLGLGL